MVHTVEPVSHLQTVFQQDLLPVAHQAYLMQMTAEPKVIYDIGACVLHWTRHAVRRWPAAQIFLFDGAESSKPYFQQSGLLWHIDVLCDRDDKWVDFYEDSENPGGNSYYRETTGAFTEEHLRRTDGMTLDTIVATRGWPLPDLIKLDIQGAELDVLKGSPNCLNNCTDVILEAQHVQYNEGAPLASDVISFMHESGFRLVSNFCAGDADGDYHFTRDQ
jgi:FkbM family methyltransferase